MSVFKKINGIIGSFLRLDAANSGPALKNNSGALEVRNADDSSFVVTRGANPVGPNDYVTKSYADTLEKPIIVPAQADTSVSLPSNTGVERYVAVTTAGSGAVIGDILIDDGTGSGTMTILPKKDGRTIATTVALSGGTVELDPDSIYLWDEGGTTWVKIGDIGSVTGASRCIRYPITNAATQDSAAQIPANARVTSVCLEITTAYPGGTTIDIGNTATADLILDQTDNDPVLGVFTWCCDQDTDWGGADSVVRTTIGGSPGSGAGVVTVKYCLPNG